MALPRCAALASPDIGWTTVDLGPFSLQLPREYARRQARGIDSYVGSFAAPGRVLSFDHGAYSNALSLTGLGEVQDYRACREMIGGRVARVVRARRDTLYFAGAAWRELEQGGLGATHLTITVESADELGQDEAMRILRSVRFP